MRRVKRKVIYTDEELSAFYPSWLELSKNSTFPDWTTRLRDILLVTDEEPLCNGSSPLIPELNEYTESLRKKVTHLRPDWSLARFSDFIFYCLHHEDGSAEYDFSAAVREALENSKAKSAE